MKASNQDAGARELERMQREKIAQNSHIFARQWTELDQRTEKEVTTDRSRVIKMSKVKGQAFSFG